MLYLRVSNIWYTFSKFITSTGQVSTLVGSGASGSSDGVGTNAKFSNPYGIAVNPVGTLLYVADSTNSAIRTIALPSGYIYALYLRVYL